MTFQTHVRVLVCSWIFQVKDFDKESDKDSDEESDKDSDKEDFWREFPPRFKDSDKGLKNGTLCPSPSRGGVTVGQFWVADYKNKVFETSRHDLRTVGRIFSQKYSLKWLFLSILWVGKSPIVRKGCESHPSHFLE